MKHSRLATEHCQTLVKLDKTCESRAEAKEL